MAKLDSGTKLYATKDNKVWAFVKNVSDGNSYAYYKDLSAVGDKGDPSAEQGWQYSRKSPIWRDLINQISLIYPSGLTDAGTISDPKDMAMSNYRGSTNLGRLPNFPSAWAERQDVLKFLENPANLTVNPKYSKDWSGDVSYKPPVKLSTAPPPTPPDLSSTPKTS